MRSQPVSQQLEAPPFGPIGREVYERTYRRKNPDGTFETWPDTVERVVNGNVALVPARCVEPDEADKLRALLLNFDVLPAGRHLFATGVPGRQFLNNCHCSGWSKDDIALHSSYLFDMLMQGGGVGSNYSNRYVDTLPPVRSFVDLHLTCDPKHADFASLGPNRSSAFSPEWGGALRIQDSREGWCVALETLLRRHFNGGGALVLDLSLVRPSGVPLRTFGGMSSGPAPLASALHDITAFLNNRVGRVLRSLDWMAIDHACAKVVVSGGVRRSSRMAIKAWSDADIMEFIRCKQRDGDHWSTNISVEIDDAFLAALQTSTHRNHKQAKAVHSAVVAGMLTNGEPGYWNIDHARRNEPDPDSMFSCNPCSEISFSEYDVCCLGHINLATCALHHDNDSLERFRLMARFLLRATFGDKTRAQEIASVERNRRIGVGILGFHSWLAAHNIRYSAACRSEWVRAFMSKAYETVRAEADKYAWQLRVPAPATCTAIAPTGTTSLLPGVTSGPQPVFARRFIRRVRFHESDAGLLQHIADGYPVEDDKLAPNTKIVSFVCEDPIVGLAKSAGYDPDSLIEDQSEIDLDTMLRTQAMLQETFCDNGQSFTINVPEDRKPSIDAASAVIANYLPRLRGTTIMVDGAREQAPFERLTKDQYDAWEGPKQAAQAELSCQNGSCGIGNEARKE